MTSFLGPSTTPGLRGLFRLAAIFAFAGFLFLTTFTTVYGMPAALEEAIQKLGSDQNDEGIATIRSFASKGEPAALEVFGSISEHGNYGYTANLAAAYVWYELAIIHGVQALVTRRDKVRDQLSPAELAKMDNEVGMALHAGEIVPRDTVLAMQYLTRAAAAARNDL